MFKRFLTGEEGASMTEYALLLALIAIASIVILGTLGGEVADVFSDVNDAVIARPVP